MENNTLFQEDFWDEEDEEVLSCKLPKDSELPPLIREVVTNAPKEFKIPSFIACLAPLCCLAGRVQVKYYYDSYRPSALLLQHATGNASRVSSTKYTAFRIHSVSVRKPRT